MNYLKRLLGGAVATLIAAVLPSLLPTPNPTADVLKHAVVGTAGVISQVANPAATPVVIAQIVKAQQEGSSTPLGTTTSLSVIAGAAIVLKTVKSKVDSQLSPLATVKVLQEIGMNTISATMPLLASGLVATAIGWQNVAHLHNAIIMPMVIPGIALLTLSKLATSRSSWKETAVAAGAGSLAVIAGHYHPLGVGVLLGSMYCLQKSSKTSKPAPTSYHWDASTLEVIAIPQWMQTCVWIGTTLIGIPVSQLYSIMKRADQTPLSDKTKAIREGVLNAIESLTSMQYYLLWGMAREGSFTDPMSKALQSTPIEWYVPLVGLLLVIGTVWWLFYHLEVAIPLYINYSPQDVLTEHISSLGMILLGAHLLAIPLWLPALGLGLGYASLKLGINVSGIGSMMPLIGLASSK